MKSAIRDELTLRQRLQLPPAGAATAATKSFPVFVPEPFLERIELGNQRDPLLLQVLPQPAEDESPAHYQTDPLGEAEATLRPGLLQKYRSRVLLVTTGACAVHCRYCFRRHFPYQVAPTSVDQWGPALSQIAADPMVDEVILSGGDPLTVVDETLDTLISQLGEIKHLKRLRIHSRLPVMIPQRVTDRLLAIISDTPLQTWFVLHANHANELDDAVENSLACLNQAGAMLLNQSVLLKGVNDSAEALITLSQRLLDCRAIPYYLHQLDPVVGASHFEVPRERGVELIAAMRAALPGYGVPRYVKELAGEPNKTVWA